MSLASVSYISNPSHSSFKSKNDIFFMAIPTCRSIYSTSPSLSELVFRIPRGSMKLRRNPIFPGVNFFSPVMEWQDCTVKMEVDIPVSVAYKCYSDRAAIPKWMPFISSVEVLEDNPSFSRWSLKQKAFGQDIEYSWLARNMQPIPNQKIHWRSLEGLPNRGAVRFYPKGPSSCIVELTISYEVPPLLAPVASVRISTKHALISLFSHNHKKQKFTFQRGLESFATFAKKYQTA